MPLSRYLDSEYSRPPRRTATSTLAGGSDQQIVCSVTESRGISPTVGLAFVNLSTAEIVLSQISDSQSYIRTLHKLHVFEPSEILVPNTTNSKLLQILKGNNLHFEVPIRSVSRNHWDEGYGNESIQHLAFQEDIEAIKVSVDGKYFAITCLSAVSSCFLFFLEMTYI